ncbi:MAG: EAL domain-containing protein [Ruminococcus sp.]|nr:EAL domain-containing protein [Ruminococcus sp.]
MHNNFNKQGKDYKTRKILIAEDEFVNREILINILGNSFDILTAEDGEATLSVIEREYNELSLVLLDLNMPKLSGLELLKRIKDEPKYKSLPVIVMTADSEAEVESLMLGAVDFIPKPYPEARIVNARIIRTIELFEDRELISATERDSVTGLYNKEYFYKYCTELDSSAGEAGMDAAVIDINHFHIINDRFGMSYGDEILRAVSDRLREFINAKGGIVCRKEGDMFLAYLPGGCDFSEMIASASVTLKKDESANSSVRLRAGVYRNADRTVGIEARFDRAKMAADTIRNNLTKNIEYYDSSLRDKELYTEQLVDDFRTAIDQGHFVVYFQPKFDIRPREAVLASAEALVRWKHPTFGMISPGVFIPLFEGNGLIQELDLFVWRAAARQIRDWKDRLGYTLPVSVNVSRIDLYDPDLIDILQGIVSENGLSPADLLLEITESAYTEESYSIVETIVKLRELGFKIEMDDFGSGYSSLNMLSTLPIDALKLDMKFIKSAFSLNKDTRMLEVIIDMAKYLGVPVIAEGVETKEQLDSLKVIGCDIVQGYYFSRPVPAADLEPFIEKRILQAAAGRTEQELLSIRKAQSALSGISFSSIAQALSKDYFSIYYVDTESGRFIEYSSSREYQSLEIEKGGEDFFGLSRRNILRVVHPDDIGMILSAFTKENILSALRDSGSFTMTYRLMLGGVPNYVHLKAAGMEHEGKKYIVVGVSSIDRQIKSSQSGLTNEVLL